MYADDDAVTGNDRADCINTCMFIYVHIMYTVYTEEREWKSIFRPLIPSKITNNPSHNKYACTYN